MNHGKPWKQDAWLQANNMWELILVTAGGRGHGSRGLCGLCWLRWLTTWRILSFCLFSRNVTYPIPRQFDTKCWECPCTGRPTMYRQTNDVPADQQCTGRPTMYRQTNNVPADQQCTGRPTMYRQTNNHIQSDHHLHWYPQWTSGLFPAAGCFRQRVVSGSGLFPAAGCFRQRVVSGTVLCVPYRK